MSVKLRKDGNIQLVLTPAQAFVVGQFLGHTNGTTNNQLLPGSSTFQVWTVLDDILEEHHPTLGHGLELDDDKPCVKLRRWNNE